MKLKCTMLGHVSYLFALLFIACATQAHAQSDVYVDLTFPGQELGTVLSPFDTLTDALGAVSGGGTIHLEPGDIYSLYINGVYKGYYNVTERHDADFLSNHFAATTDWDILTHSVNVADPNDPPQVKDGDLLSWNALMAAVVAQDAAPSQPNYDAIAALLDIDRFIDYIMVQLYVGNWDWPNNNWGAAHERIPGAKWVFLVWDSEGAYETWGTQITGLNYFPIWWWPPQYGLGLAGEREGYGPGQDTYIANIYRACALNAGFKTIFQTRAATHLGPGGALDEPNVQARYDELEAIMVSVLPGGVTFDDYIDTTWIGSRFVPLTNDLIQHGLYQP